MKTIEQLQARITELETTLAERDRRVWILEQAKEWPDVAQSATTAGDATEASDYAHLPHGGWWVHDGDMLYRWSSFGDFFKRYTMSGSPDMSPYVSCSWSNWIIAESHNRTALTRDQIIAIIEKHKASKEPTPAFKAEPVKEAEKDIDPQLFELVKGMCHNYQTDRFVPSNTVGHARKLLAEMRKEAGDGK